MELLPPRQREHKETVGRGLRVIILGPSCTGKSTSTQEMAKFGHRIGIEPENPAFSLFLESPQNANLALLNQATKLTGLAVQALEEQKKSQGENIILESSVAAPIVYGWYFLDKKIISPEQFKALEVLHTSFKEFFRPDLVVYLDADDTHIGERALRRDGAAGNIAQQILHTQEMRPYWNRLLAEFENEQIPVEKIDTTHLSTTEVGERIHNRMQKITL